MSFRRKSSLAWSRRDSASSAATRAARASRGATPWRRRVLRLFDVATPIHGRLFRNQLGANLPFDVFGNLRMLLQEGGGIFLALPHPFTLVAVPRTGFLHQIVQHTDLDEFAFLGDSRAVHDFELSLAKRWRHFVLDHLDPRHRPDHFLAILDGADAADIHAHR